MKPPFMSVRGKNLFLHVLLAACLLIFAAPSSLPAGEKKNRYDALVDTYLSGISSAPSSYRAFLNLIEILRIRDLAGPGKVDEAVKKIAKKGKLHPQAAILARHYAVAQRSSSGDFAEAAKMIAQSGILTDWLVIGPFDNQDLKGYEKEMGPELDLGEPFSLGLAYEGDERSVNWREAASDPISGVLFLDRFLYPDVKVCGYGGTYIEAAKDRSVRFWGVSSGTFILWVDGSRIIDDTVYRGFGPMRHAADIFLKKGMHQVMAKVCIDTGSWQLSVQTTDASGNGAPLKHGTKQELAKLYKIPKSPPKPKQVKTALKELEELAADESNAEGAGDYARLLMLTGSDDVKEKKAQDVAKRAAEASGKCRDYITLSLTADEENKAAGALKKCLLAEPGNADAAYLMLGHLRDILSFPDYAGQVEHYRKKFPDDPMMAILKAEVLEDAGMPLKAFKELEKTRERFGDLPVILDRLYGLASQAATKEQSDKLLDELIKIRADDPAARHDLIRRLVRDGQHEKALEEIARLMKYFWTSESSIQLAVEQLLATGDTEAAEKVLDDETKRAAQNPQAWESLGVFYNMTGDSKLALACFKTVLDLNPQNVQVRQYISNLMPEEKFEVPYIKDGAFLAGLDEKLKDKGKPGEGDAWSTANIDVTILVEQEVDRVYENGTSARFVQNSLRVNSEQGAKLQRYQFISYSPMRQDLKILRAAVIHPDGTVEDATGQYTIPVVEEAYRLYYDDANEVIEMPSLKPGDIVDLQYKLSDEEVRNMWERHFGNIVALRTIYPKLYFLYEIIADKSTKLYFDSPKDAGLKYGEKASDGTTTYRWEGSDIPPVIAEPEMPPVIELSPLIRVTTFGSWEEFGTWWWALASPQMVVDKAIKQKVADLVKDKKTEDEKIAAIFDWVIRSTRYVGLEFGIHGFKPYRTTEIVSRGFGDCKDKATLLYVMLKEAGIDAAIALVRTRNAGIINSSFPFQFLFDHAIAAVPSKNLYLDGTVDYLNYDTLPPADQGVFSLIVSEGKVEPRMTAILPPETNTQEVGIAMDILGSGDAAIRGKVKASGIITSYYRSTYQTEGTRKERLESELSSIFPGVAITSHTFTGLESFGDDVEVAFEASVPGIAMVSKDEIQMTALPSYGLYKRYASRSKRKFAVLTNHLRVFIDHYTYKAPPGTVLSSVPKSVSIGGDKAGYSFNFDVKMIDPANLEIKATLKIGVFRIETDQYDAFREFCRKVDEATAQRIHMKKLAP